MDEREHREWDGPVDISSISGTEFGKINTLLLLDEKKKKKTIKQS